MEYNSYYPGQSEHPSPNLSNHQHGGRQMQSPQQQPPPPTSMMHTSRQAMGAGHQLHQQQIIGQQMAPQHHSPYHQIQPQQSHGSMSHSSSPHGQHQSDQSMQPSLNGPPPQSQSHHHHPQSPYHHAGPHMHIQPQPPPQSQQQPLNHMVRSSSIGPSVVSHSHVGIQQPVQNHQNFFSGPMQQSSNVHHFSQQNHHHPMSSYQHPQRSIMQQSQPQQVLQERVSPSYPGILQTEFRVIEMNRRLQARPVQRHPISPLPNPSHPFDEGSWWERFATEFFEDDATITLRMQEDRPVEFTIGRTLIPKFFRTYFDGGVTDLSINLRNPKETCTQPHIITLDCDQATIVTHNSCKLPSAPGQGVVVHTEGRLVLEFVNNIDSLSIKSWKFYTKNCREFLDRSIIALGLPTASLVEPITRQGLTKSTVSYLKMCMIMEPMQDIIVLNKHTNLDPRSCMQKLLADKYKFRSTDDGRASSNKKRKRKPPASPAVPGPTGRKSKATLANIANNNSGANNTMLVSPSGSTSFSLTGSNSSSVSNGNVAVNNESHSVTPSLLQHRAQQPSPLQQQIRMQAVDPQQPSQQALERTGSCGPDQPRDQMDAGVVDEINQSQDVGQRPSSQQSRHSLTPQPHQSSQHQQSPSHQQPSQPLQQQSPQPQQKTQNQNLQIQAEKHRQSPSGTSTLEVKENGQLPSSKDEESAVQTSSESQTARLANPPNLSNEVTDEKRETKKSDQKSIVEKTASDAKREKQSSPSTITENTAVEPNQKQLGEHQVTVSSGKQDCSDKDDSVEVDPPKQAEIALEEIPRPTSEDSVGKENNGSVLNDEVQTNSIATQSENQFNIMNSIPEDREDICKPESIVSKLPPSSNTKSLALQNGSSNKQNRRRSSERKQTVIEGLMRTSEFVVAIKDLKCEHPALWRITTGNNLLQQFEPKTQNGVVLYENTNQYAGWNHEIKRDYVGVDVRLTQHTRNQITVEKIFLNFKKLDNVEAFYDKHFVIYLQILISTALDPKFWEGIESEPEHHDYFVTSRKIIDDIIKRYKSDLSDKLKKQNENFTDAARTVLLKNFEKYPSFLVKPITDNEKERICRACNTNPSTQVVTFENKSYDLHSYKPVKVTSELTKTDDRHMHNNLCDICLNIVRSYSEIHHMSWKFFGLAREKVESHRARGKPINTILDECLKDNEWLTKMYAERDALWSRIERVQ